jgi:hypothetical protein
MNRQKECRSSNKKFLLERTQHTGINVQVLRRRNMAVDSIAVDSIDGAFAQCNPPIVV